MPIRANKVQQVKIDSVASLQKMVDIGGDFIFAEYRGLTVAQMTELRKKLRARQAEFHVVKNAYAKLALKSNPASARADEVLSGPTAIAFSRGETNEVAKVLFDFAKEAPLLKIKAGIIDSNFMTTAQMVMYSKLPGRNQLLSMLLSAMNGPMQGLVGTLNAIPQKLVRTLAAVAEQKGSA